MINSWRFCTADNMTLGCPILQNLEMIASKGIFPLGGPRWVQKYPFSSIKMSFKTAFLTSLVYVVAVWNRISTISTRSKFHVDILNIPAFWPRKWTSWPKISGFWHKFHPNRIKNAENRVVGQWLKYAFISIFCYRINCQILSFFKLILMQLSSNY